MRLPSHMPLLAAALAALAIGGCATAPTGESTASLFHDSLFAPPSEPVSPAQVFALSDEMRRYVREVISQEFEPKGRQKALFDALYSKNQLRLEYDSALTRTAAQAFHARAGNCLSLAIMTAAFARDLGLTVRYQRIFADESWSRNADMYFASGHVNITLGHKNPDPRVLFAERNALTIDFIPLTDSQALRSYEIDENTIVAMYMNNRAAELLALGRLDDAYWHAREAIDQDPRLLIAVNTLGVIYRRHDNLAESEAVLRYALEREPANANTMSNLALVLQDLGRTAEAREVTARLARLQSVAPFADFNRGLEAVRAGDFKLARDLFSREVARDSYNAEFHFWLSVAYFGLGDPQAARAELTVAMENSNTRGEHDRYAAKLRKLKSAGAAQGRP